MIIKRALKKFYSYFYDKNFIPTLFWPSCIIAFKRFEFGKVREAWFLLGCLNIDSFRKCADQTLKLFFNCFLLGYISSH